MRLHSFLPLLFLFIATALHAQSADFIVVNKVPNDSGEKGSISFVDYTAGTTVATVAVDREPHEIERSADGRYALVANTGGYKTPNNTLSLIDVAEQRVARTVNLGALRTPHGLAYAPAHGVFYFTAEGSSVIGAYDPAADSLTWVQGTGQAGTHMLLVSDDGRTIVTANRDGGTVSVFKLEGDDPLAAAAWTGHLLEVGEKPEGLAFSPDGTQAWVGLRGGDGIVIVNLAAAKISGRFPLRNHPVARLLFTPDGRYLLAADPNEGSVLFINAERREIERIVPVGDSAESLFLPPGGTHLLVGVASENAIVEIDLETREVTRRIDGGPYPDAMVWIGQED